jgi:hypothetical protein
MYNITPPEIVIICGPVIGKVTQTTARILIEIKYKATLTLSLSPVTSKKAKSVRMSKILQPKTPAIFDFEHLSPDCHYKVVIIETHRVKGPPEVKKCQFRTLPLTPPEKLRIAVISCNSMEAELKCDTKYSLWHHLAERIEAFDYVFHNSGLVYLDEGSRELNSDSIYMRLRKKYEKFNFNEHTTEIREAIKEEYRKIYNYQPIANILRNAPNLMILDEHEVAEGFGFKENFIDKTSFDYFYAEQARYVYYQYQRQLMEDINFNDFSKLTGEHCYGDIAGLGVFVLDHRGCRTWYKEEDNELKLGTKQWNDLTTCFGQGGLFTSDNIQSVILLTPTIPVYVPGDGSRLEGMSKDFLSKQWTEDCKEEQVKLLKLLMDFEYNTCKETAIVGGNINAKGLTDIKYKGQTLLKQFITSGISIKTPNQDIPRVPIDEALADKFTFKHYDFTNLNNYGIIEIVKNKDMNHEIFGTHCEASEREKILPREGKQYMLRANRKAFSNVKKSSVLKTSSTNDRTVSTTERTEESKLDDRDNCCCRIF